MVKCHFDIAKRNEKEHSNTIQVMLHVEFRQKGLCGIVISSDVILQQYIGNDKVCFLFENTHSKVQIKFNVAQLFNIPLFPNHRLLRLYQVDMFNYVSCQQRNQSGGICICHSSDSTVSDGGTANSLCSLLYISL